MRILHLNTYDTNGGAARATYRLHKGLLRLGFDSSMMVAQRSSDDPTVIAFTPPMDLASRLRRRIRQQRIRRSFARYLATRPAGYEKFSDDRSCYGDTLARGLPPCDVINLHWIADFLDYRAFFSMVPHGLPMFWRLSDMNAFTGGCHFDDGCARHATGCGLCPQIGSSDPADLSHQIWQRKRDVFSRLEPTKLHIIVLNRWMADLAAHSPLLAKFPVTIIPNGVDVDTFFPRDRGMARALLQLPQDRQIILFAADVVTNRRKGFALLAEALKPLADCGKYFLLSVGGGVPRIDCKIPHSHLAHVDEESKLSLVYGAADLYVIPSLQDNQPNTALEAMACGTPVVGFNVGGIPEMVRPGITGLLAAAGDAAGLSRAIREILGSPDRRAEMAAACRRTVLNEYRLETQVQRYAELYQAAVEQRCGAAAAAGSRSTRFAPGSANQQHC